MALGSSFRTLTADNMEGVLGVKNYVKSSFETGVTDGWHKFNATLTSGLPTGAPTIDTAASLTTFAATSTTPLTGAYSLQVGTSSAAWGAGQGIISDVFTIDRMDGGKVITVSFDYEAIAGASNANWSGQLGSQSFAVYVYDVSASAWIQPAGFLGLNQSSGAGRVSATFQSSVVVGQQYRVAVICLQATIASQTITLNFDNFVCSRQIVPVGPVVTDWGTYSGKVYEGTTDRSSEFSEISTYWRRVGDSIEIQFNLARNASASAGAGGNVYVTFPTGPQIDTSNGNNNTANGIWFSSNSNIIQGTFQTGGTSPSGAALAWFIVNVDTSPFAYNNTNFAPNLRFGGFMRFKMQGYSSNVQMSNDTDTRVVAFQAVSTPTASPSATASLVKYTSFNSDTHGAFSTSTGLYTVPVSGYYRVQSGLSVGATFVNNGYLALIIYQNGAGAFSSFNPTVSASSNTSITVSNTVFCKAGDTLAPYVQTNGSGAAVSVVFPGNNYFSVERISGPSVLAATETVALDYRTNAGQSIPNNVLTSIVWGTKTYDTHGIMNTSTGTITIPISGKYMISSAYCFGNYAWTAGTQASLSVIKNGSYYGILSRGNETNATTTKYDSGRGSMLVQCNAGDTIQIQVVHTFGSAINLQADTNLNYVTMSRVGN